MHCTSQCDHPQPLVMYPKSINKIYIVHYFIKITAQYKRQGWIRIRNCWWNSGSVTSKKGQHPDPDMQHRQLLWNIWWFSRNTNNLQFFPLLYFLEVTINDNFIRYTLGINLVPTLRFWGFQHWICKKRINQNLSCPPFCLGSLKFIRTF